MDRVVGGQQVKSDFERYIQMNKENMKRTVAEIQNILNNNKGLLPEQKQSLEIIQKNLNIIINGKNEISVSALQAIKNNITNKDLAKYAYQGTIGVAEGTVKTVITTISSVLDLTALIFNYTTKGSEYRSEINAQAKKMWEVVKSVKVEDLKKAIAKTWDHINSLPGEEQARAIGNFSGYVIGFLIPMGVFAKGSKLEKLAKSRALSTTATTTEVAKYQAIRIGLFLLDGPAEHLIGKAIGTSIRKTAQIIRGTAAIDVKMVEINETINLIDVELAKNPKPDAKKKLQEAKNAMEGEKKKLESQQKKTETQVIDSKKPSKGSTTQSTENLLIKQQATNMKAANDEIYDSLRKTANKKSYTEDMQAANDEIYEMQKVANGYYITPHQERINITNKSNQINTPNTSVNKELPNSTEDINNSQYNLENNNITSTLSDKEIISQLTTEQKTEIFENLFKEIQNVADARKGTESAIDRRKLKEILNKIHPNRIHYFEKNFDFAQQIAKQYNINNDLLSNFRHIKTTKKSNVVPEETLLKNSTLSDSERLLKADEILGIKLSDTQKEALLKAHNIPQGQNIIKGRILMRKQDNGELTFSREQAQRLMDEGIAGKYETNDDTQSIKNINTINDNNIPPKNIQENLDAVRNMTSLKGKLPNLKWSHRTDMEALQNILNSGYIGANSDRGVNFWLGKGAGYGDIQIIMKDSVQNLPSSPQAKNTLDLVPGSENMGYFFRNQAQGNKMNVQEYSQNFGDFRHINQENGNNPHINVPYLYIGGKNANNSKHAHSVGTEHIEAVMIPTHIRNLDAYQNNIKPQLEAKGIQIIEIPTPESALDYIGNAVIYAHDNQLGGLGKQIHKELEILYPGIKNSNERILQYMKDKQYIDANNTDTIDILELKYAAQAQHEGLTRGARLGGHYYNYVDKTTDNIEQQAYFDYLIRKRHEELTGQNIFIKNENKTPTSNEVQAPVSPTNSTKNTDASTDTLKVAPKNELIPNLENTHKNPSNHDTKINHFNINEEDFSIISKLTKEQKTQILEEIFKEFGLIRKQIPRTEQKIILAKTHPDAVSKFEENFNFIQEASRKYNIKEDILATFRAKNTTTTTNIDNSILRIEDKTSIKVDKDIKTPLSLKNFITNNFEKILKTGAVIAIIGGSMGIVYAQIEKNEIIFTNSKNQTINEDEISKILEENDNLSIVETSVESHNVLKNDIQKTEYLQGVISNEFISNIENPTHTEIISILNNSDLRKQAGHTYVFALQSALSILGFGEKMGKIDGFIGSKTLSALKDFQTIHTIGYSISDKNFGRLDLQTTNAIIEELKKQE